MVGVRSGRFNGSSTLLTSYMITNAAEAYTVIIYMTLRLFNSCQNRDSLPGLPDIVICGLVKCKVTIQLYTSQQLIFLILIEWISRGCQTIW